jgi:hypothetical protein
LAKSSSLAPLGTSPTPSGTLATIDMFWPLPVSGGAAATALLTAERLVPPSIESADEDALSSYG